MILSRHRLRPHRSSGPPSLVRTEVLEAPNRPGCSAGRWARQSQVDESLGPSCDYQQLSEGGLTRSRPQDLAPRPRSPRRPHARVWQVLVHQWLSPGPPTARILGVSGLLGSMDGSSSKDQAGKIGHQAAHHTFMSLMRPTELEYIEYVMVGIRTDLMFRFNEAIFESSHSPCTKESHCYRTLS